MGAPNDPQIAALIESSTRLSKTSEELAFATTEQQERAKLARFRYRATIFMLILGFALLGWRQQIANNASQHARDKLIDCTIPTGQCYHQGQRQTGKAIQQLEQITIDSAVCAIITPSATQKSIERCVTALLIRHH